MICLPFFVYRIVEKGQESVGRETLHIYFTWPVFPGPTGSDIVLLQGTDTGTVLSCPVFVSDLVDRQLLQILFLQQKQIPPGMPSSSRARRPLLAE